MARREIRLGREARESVPGADELAVVAAVNAIAEERAQLYRDRAAQFDG